MDTNTSPNALPVLAQRMDKEGNIDLNQLQHQELERITQLNRSLVTNDVNSVLNYGADLQATMEKYSNDFLQQTRTMDAGEVGTHINELLSELNYIDVDELSPKGFKGFLMRVPGLKSLILDIKKIFQKYDKIIVNVDKISNKIKAGRINSLKDNTALQTMFDNNVEYIKQIEELIIAGKYKLEELKTQLAEMEVNSAQYQDYEIADTREFVTRLDKRLADMKIIRYVMIQSLAQIRVVQNNNVAIADKAQSIISTTIPVWKNQLTIAVALYRQKANVEMQRKVSETTNTILEKNAEMLRQNSIEVAKENENTIVSIDTLKKTTNSLISTLNEVKRIHEEGMKNREVLDKELQSLEGELRKSVGGN
ncbi:toxic anion resistance protein [Dysgonomonas sp. Marseille-P4677]|uniref:toxic anion resistance protein n=1 Tax=Dysgonomonas sp. Marseille-P4677 TaxID=2364790 RepID=UPI001912D000|nr:toxic anion resistance protein [Dysgonomonas sp. Marseille-P4677]MBK5720877.1 toxic anion resistance protein [Dysgonomonas sp. Marseille-P4677]